MTTVKIYRNKRNRNKFIEVHNDGHYHNAVRQFMFWTRKIKRRPVSKIKNYNGDGCLHRWKIKDLMELLNDYEEVKESKL